MTLYVSQYVGVYWLHTGILFMVRQWVIMTALEFIMWMIVSANDTSESVCVHTRAPKWIIPLRRDH